jgi:methionyl aminopeptidase
MNRKSKSEIKILREAGRLTALTHEHVEPHIKPGISLFELDRIIREFIWGQKCTPSFLGYKGFPSSACYSINEMAVHAPASDRKLKDGDIITVDIGVNHMGFHGDCARTHVLGEISEEATKFLNVCKEALAMQKEMCKPGVRLLDIAYEVEHLVESNGYKIIKQLGGHGVGTSLHEEPFVPNYYDKTLPKTKLEKGMVLAFEPVIGINTGDVYVLDDKWTVVTADGSLATHEEDMLAITEDGCEVLTQL